jgi:ascorbate-specific PTS system EIIC-type component UlaA
MIRGKRKVQSKFTDKQKANKNNQKLINSLLVFSRASVARGLYLYAIFIVDIKYIHSL